MKLSAKILGLENVQKALLRLDPVGSEIMSTGLKQAAIMVHEEAVKSIRRRSAGRVYHRGRITHVASKPGDPPNVDTGELISGVTWEPQNGKALAVFVGTNVKHGVYMEFGTKDVAPRPWLLPALRKHQDKISKLFTSKALRKALKG